VHFAGIAFFGFYAAVKYIVYADAFFKIGCKRARDMRTRFDGVFFFEFRRRMRKGCRKAAVVRKNY